jgi:hypothetical protein
MGIYGRAECTEGQYKDYRIGHQDLQQISYNFEAAHYEFEGKAFDDDVEIFDIIMERKMGGNGDIAESQRSKGLKR